MEWPISQTSDYKYYLNARKEIMAIPKSDIKEYKKYKLSVFPIENQFNIWFSIEKDKIYQIRSLLDKYELTIHKNEKKITSLIFNRKHNYFAAVLINEYIYVFDYGILWIRMGDRRIFINGSVILTIINKNTGKIEPEKNIESMYDGSLKCLLNHSLTNEEYSEEISFNFMDKNDGTHVITLYNGEVSIKKIN